MNACGGVLERGAEQFVIRSEGLFQSLDDSARGARRHPRRHAGLPARTWPTVAEGWAPRQGVVSRGDQLDAVEGIVLMRRGENPSVVLARAARRGRARSNARLAADGRARSTPFYDRTELVDTTLQTVGHNLLEGALLVTLVLFVFLLDLRAALIVGGADPALAAGVVHLPEAARHVGQPALAWARSTSASSSTAGW